MDRTTLEAAVNALVVPYHKAAEELYATIKAKLNETLVEAGIDKIAKLRYGHGESAEIEVERPGKSYGDAMTLYFYERWNDAGSAKKREVMLNVGTFGSFNAAMEPEVNFYIVAGAVAKSLSKLQEKFDAIDFEPYHTARRNYYRAKCELEKFDNDQQMEERLNREHEVEAKLVVGAKLRIGKTWKNEPIFDVIERVTNKLIFLKNGYGRQTKKTEAISNLLNKKWEFAA